MLDDPSPREHHADLPGGYVQPDRTPRVADEPDLTGDPGDDAAPTAPDLYSVRYGPVDPGTRGERPIAIDVWAIPSADDGAYIDLIRDNAAGGSTPVMATLRASGARHLARELVAAADRADRLAHQVYDTDPDDDRTRPDHRRGDYHPAPVDVDRWTYISATMSVPRYDDGAYATVPVVAVGRSADGTSVVIEIAHGADGTEAAMTISEATALHVAIGDALASLTSGYDR